MTLISKIIRRGAVPMIAACVLCSSAAFAQGGRRDKAAAEALFTAGRKLVEAGDDAAGCPKLEASLALYPSTGTMLNIARCHERGGKIATAWQDYRQALLLNRETQDPKRRSALAELAEKGARDLEPRLPKLKIRASNAPPGLSVLRDGNEITAAELSQEMPADPGPHEIRASAPGYRAETLTVTLTEGKTATIDLSLQPADGSAAGGRASGGFLLPMGVAFLAVGVGGLGAGATTGVLSLNKVSAVEASCGGVHCLPTDTESQREVREARTLGNISTASFIAGGVLAASGAVMLILHQSSKNKPTPDATRTAGVGVSLGFGRVTLQARF